MTLSQKVWRDIFFTFTQLKFFYSSQYISIDLLSYIEYYLYRICELVAVDEDGQGLQPCLYTL